ncbi:S-adenosyl-L-methionine-dependent methyltransferase [Earliella scabrosa]|nr:S-adenosyl-L-methionine-dependent methyltransferase [Earliella scabrosa]
MATNTDHVDNATPRDYIFRPSYNESEEYARLDLLNQAFSELYGGRLSFSDLGDLQPTSILEIGSGTGSWTLQAASHFPQARVTAVDLNPLPRTLPPNVEFRRIDLTEGLPFEPSSFDIVHARLVLMHIPNAYQIISQAIELVKPGGWLLMEEPDDEQMLDGGGPLGPGMDAFLQAWFTIFRGRKLEPCIGRDLERTLTESGAFEELHVTRITTPLSEKSKDPALNKFGKAWRLNMIRVGKDLPLRFGEHGITEEVAQMYLEELQDPTRALTTDLYCVRARKGSTKTTPTAKTEHRL